MHAHTLYGSYRPFGASSIMASHDSEGYRLYLLDPSGHNYVFLSNYRDIMLAQLVKVKQS